jgi:acetyl-CoA C-acetyltransferase
MRKVAVVGAGMSHFGWQPEKGIKELGEEANFNALKGASVDPKDIQVAYCGNATGGAIGRQWTMIGQICLKELGITGIPITNVENACCSGSCAIREAWIAIGAGLYDVAIAMGIEKGTDKTPEERAKAGAGTFDADLEGALGMSGVTWYSMVAQRYFKKYGNARDQLSKIVVRSRKNASLNEYAMRREPVTAEDVMNSPVEAEPIHRMDCTTLTDGAAAVILMSEDVARKITDTPVWIVAFVLRTGTYPQDFTMTSFTSTVNASRDAFRQANMSEKDIDFAEVHDCFSIAEVIRCEDLGFFKRGEYPRAIDEGTTEINGDFPVNPSGGLLSRGHPYGATGVAQAAEIFWQLRGEAGKRQVKGAEVGLSHTTGGLMFGDSSSCVVNIFHR